MYQLLLFAVSGVQARVVPRLLQRAVGQEEDDQEQRSIAQRDARHFRRHVRQRLRRSLAGAVHLAAGHLRLVEQQQRARRTRQRRRSTPTHAQEGDALRSHAAVACSVRLGRRVRRDNAALCQEGQARDHPTGRARKCKRLYVPEACLIVLAVDQHRRHSRYFDLLADVQWRLDGEYNFF